MTDPKRTTPNPMPVSHVVGPDKPLFAASKPYVRPTGGDGGSAIPFATQPTGARKPKQRRTTEQRYRKDVTPIRPGDVLAVGLDNGRCPVGMVDAANNFYIRLNLCSWVTGEFSAGTAIVRHEQVREFSDLAAQDDGGVFQMDPLAAFQTAWTEARR